jgi:hypothetical protein
MSSVPTVSSRRRRRKVGLDTGLSSKSRSSSCTEEEDEEEVSSLALLRSSVDNTSRATVPSLRNKPAAVADPYIADPLLLLPPLS